MAQRFDFMNLMVAKTGTTYPTSRETASTPVAANALIAFDVTIEKTQEKLERTQVDGEPGILRSAAFAKEAWSMAFKTYLGGSGTAGTAPGWRLPMRACGMTEAIVASGGSAGVTYAQASIHAAHEWCDLRLGWALEDYFCHGARGNYEITLASNALPTIAWTFQGAYNIPTNSAMLTPVYTAQPPARPVNSANTQIFTVGATPYAVCVNNFTFTPGNEIIHHDDAQCQNEFIITNRAPGGQIICRTPDELASFNAWQKVTEGSTDPVQVQHGPAGNRVTINLSAIAYDDVKTTGVDGMKYWTIAYMCTRAAGDPSVGTIVLA